MAQLSHVDQFATSAESWSQMWRLYDILDRNGDGVLSSDDWPAGSDEWQMLQSRFDINGDNKITRDEFVYRLKLMAYEQPIDARLFPAMPTNHAQCLEELTRSANYQIQVLCKQLFEAVSDSLGPPANVQKVSDSQGATSPPPAAKVSVQLVTYQFRGGAPPHRGFHRQGQLQVHNFDPTTSVKYVKAQISPQDRVLVCKPGEQLPPSPTEFSAGFQDLPTEGIVKDCLPEGSFLVVLKSMQMGYDIGVFEQAVDPNTHFLVGDSPSDSMLTPSTVKQLISSKGADPDAAFRVLPSSFVPPQARRVLVEHLEREHAAKPEEDLKLTLSHAELAALIGTGLADDVVHEFGKCDKIRLRRCEAHGKSINLHTDFHRRTMQVPLNGDDEYDGGKLVYVNKYGLHWPRRAAGSATVHDNTILHGVSELKAGVRYSLFLQEE